MSEDLLAKDLMNIDVVVTRETESAADVCDRFQQAHVHGAPVVDDEGKLVGMVTLEDILIGSMTWPPATETEADDAASRFPQVKDIMTSPAISAGEETTVQDLCTMMWRFRIHHIPIVNQSKVTGIVSSLDICRLFTGEALESSE